MNTGYTQSYYWQQTEIANPSLWIEQTIYLNCFWIVHSVITPAISHASRVRLKPLPPRMHDTHLRLLPPIFKNFNLIAPTLMLSWSKNNAYLNCHCPISKSHSIALLSGWQVWVLCLFKSTVPKYLSENEYLAELTLLTNQQLTYMSTVIPARDRQTLDWDAGKNIQTAGRIFGIGDNFLFFWS